METFRVNVTTFTLTEESVTPVFNPVLVDS